MSARHALFFVLTAAGLVLLASGCRRPAPQEADAAPPTSTTAPPAVSASASAAPAAMARDRKDKPLTEDEKKRIATHEAAIARGRKATRDKDYQKAIVAFSEAATADPSDGRALAERGFAKLLQGDLQGADNDLEAAMALTSDPELLSAIWFNLGLTREKEKDEEGARVAFANAHLLKPSAATRAKTAGKPTCTVEVRRANLTDLTSAAGWMGLHRILGPSQHDETPAPRNEQEAEAQVCVGSRETCAEDAVFSVMRDYMMYTWNQPWVFPRGKRLFWVYNSGSRIGGWEARCYGHKDTEASVEQGLIRVRIWNDGRGAAFDGEVNDEGRCKDAPGWTTEDYFDAKTGKALASIHWMGSSGAKIRVERRAVVIQGAGCDERIAFGQ